MSLSPIQSEQPQTNTNFSSLPAELQLEIYNHAINLEKQTKRIHSVRSHPLNPETHISNQPIPALLHLNSTSRSLYLSTLNPTYLYGTYVNLDTDTLYLSTCPDISDQDNEAGLRAFQNNKQTETGEEKQKERDGFEICKALGKNMDLLGKVKSVAVNDAFWLRPRTVTRSIVVDAWNVLVKDGLGGGLEEVLIVFDSPSSLSSPASSLSPSSPPQQDENKEKEGKEIVKTGKKVSFETMGWYQKHMDDFGERIEVDERAKRCDAFLRAYLGVSLGGNGWMRPVIKYVVYKEE